VLQKLRQINTHLEASSRSSSFPCLDLKNRDSWLLSIFLYWGHKYKIGFTDGVLLNAMYSQSHSDSEVSEGGIVDYFTN